MEGGRVPPILSLDARSSWASMEITIQERVGMFKQEEAGPQTPLSPTTSKLPREDMSIYGSLPSHDPIQLVVCKWCGRTVKDTAMLRHQELHHSSTKDNPILLNKITHSHSYKSTPTKEQKVEKKKKGKGKDHHYDPDRHCGVWLVDEKRNCLRSLTCKYHSLSLRRQVKDRSKPFDELLMLHREQKRGKMSTQTLNSQPTIIAQATSTSTSDNVQISTLLDSTALPPHQPSTMFAEMWVEESDGEGKDAVSLLSSEAGALPHSNSHPKPLACCKWRTRTVGGGHLLFNRRQDQLYSSLLRLAAGSAEDSNTHSTTVAHRKHVFSLLQDELQLRKSINNDHLQRNNFHIPSTNNSELTIRTAYSSHGKLSSIPATTVPPQSNSPSIASFQFPCPKDSIPKGQPSIERRNSILTMTPPKTPKQSRKRRRSSVEQTSPVVIPSKSNDVLVSPIPVDGLKDMPQPFVSLTDMNFRGGSIPTAISPLHQPTAISPLHQPTAISPLHQPTANHQVQDIKNCLAFSGNAFDNEQLPTQQYNKDSHKTEDNLNSVINKIVQQQQPSPSLPLPQHLMFNGMLAGSPAGSLMAMPPPPTAGGNLLSFHPPPPSKLSPHNMVQFNPAVSSHQILSGGISSLPYHEGQGDKSSNSVTLQQYLQQQMASGQMINFNQPFLLSKQPTSYHQHGFTALGSRPDNSNANFNNNVDTTSPSSLEPMLQFASAYSSDDKQSELSLFDSKKITNMNPISDQQQVT